MRQDPGRRTAQKLEKLGGAPFVKCKRSTRYFRFFRLKPVGNEFAYCRHRERFAVDFPIELRETFSDCPRSKLTLSDLLKLRCNLEGFFLRSVCCGFSALLTVDVSETRKQALLFATAAASPSVIQIRAEDIRPGSVEHAVLFALEAAAEDLSTGALVTIDPRRLRFSTLPFRGRTPEPS